LGGGSLADSVNSSKQLQQALHWYSYIGMGQTGSFFKIITYNNVYPGQVKLQKHELPGITNPDKPELKIDD